MNTPVLTPISAIVEQNGKTVRENNLVKRHRIPVGTLVEVKYDTWHGDGACSKVHARLFVVWHARDCDGTPLYHLGQNPDPLAYRTRISRAIQGMTCGFSGDSLTPIEVDDRLREGHGALEWEDSE